MEEAARSGQGPMEFVEPSKKKKKLWSFLGFLYCVVKVYSDILDEYSASIFTVPESSSGGC
jgi:hypothetical protein